MALRERFRTAVRSTDSVDALRIEIEDSNGSRGVGYATATPAITGDTLDGMERFVHDVALAHLMGRTINSELFGHLNTLTPSSSSGTAGIDMALHALDAPDRASQPATVTTSVTVSAGETDDMVRNALLRIADGFSFIKVKLGVDPDGDATRLQQIVAAVDGRAQVWVDANQGWTLHQTLTIMEAAFLYGVGPTMLEQPVRADAFDDLAFIARRLPIPVTADESAKTLHDIDRIAAGGSVQAINIKLMKFGGLTGASAAARRAQAHGLTVLVGSMMEHPDSVASAVRFASDLPANMTLALGGGTFTDDTGNVVHDLDAAWWMAAPDPCRYEAGRVRV